MSKWFLVSDLHASLRLPHARVSADGTTSDRLDDVIEVLDDMTATAKDVKPRGVWILGDLFHERHPDAPTLKAVGRALRKLADVVPVYILPGNHDAHGRNAKVYSLSLFNELRVEGMHVIDAPAWHVFTRDGEPDPNGLMRYKGIGFAVMPWMPEDRFMDALDVLAEETPAEVIKPVHSVLLMHQSIAGANANGKRLSGLSAKDVLSDGDLVISGHIHEPQRIGPSVQYLGSPIPLSFNEADGVPRGWWVLDDDDLSLTLVEMDGSPQFVRWRFAPGFGIDLVDAYEEAIDELHHDLLDELQAREVYLDVRITGPRTAVDYVAGELGTMLDLLRHKLRFVRMSRVITDDGSDRVRKAVAAAGTALAPSELVKLYAEANRALIPDGVEFDDIEALGVELVATPLTEVLK